MIQNNIVSKLKPEIILESLKGLYLRYRATNDPAINSQYHPKGMKKEPQPAEFNLSIMLLFV